MSVSYTHLIANGQTIKLRGHGAPGVNGGPAGDLYITFVIPDDPVDVYKRQHPASACTTSKVNV